MMRPPHTKHLVTAVASFFLITSVAAAGQEHRDRDYETAITKGSFQLETGDCKTTIESFKKALSVKPDDKTATFALGLAYSRCRDFPNAKQTLGQALALSPGDLRTQYELGVALYQLGEAGDARTYFTAVADGSPDARLQGSARKYLDLMTVQPTAKKFTLDLAAGLQYDSNVILEPENPAVGAERKADWRGVLTIDGNYRFLQTEKTSAEAGYQFYQSSHTKLNAFNVQDHTLRLGTKHDVTEDTKLALQYAGSYALVQSSHYSTTNTLTPQATVRFTQNSSTEFHYAFETRKYFDADNFLQNSQRTGKDNALGIAHTIQMGESAALVLGYDYDKDSADTAYWSSKGNKGSLGLQKKFEKYKLAASAAYTDRKYDDLFPGFTENRHDGIQEYTVSASRDLAKQFTLTVADNYISNDSNLPDYKYTRNIFSIFVVARL